MRQHPRHGVKDKRQVLGSDLLLAAPPCSDLDVLNRPVVPVPDDGRKGRGWVCGDGGAARDDGRRLDVLRFALLGLDGDVGAEGGSGLAGWCWVWDAEESEDVCEVVLSVGDQSLWVVSIV